MTREYAFSIAFSVCDYLRDVNNQPINHSFCMEVSDLAENILAADSEENNLYLANHIKALYEELECVSDKEQKEKVKMLIDLLTLRF